MARKKRRSNVKAVPLERRENNDLDREARIALADKKFSKAKPLLKTLYKRDPEKYKMLLAACYRGLWETMMARGQLKEAEEIRALIQELVPDFRQGSADAFLLFKNGDTQKAARMITDGGYLDTEAADAGQTAADIMVLSDGSVDILGLKNPGAAAELKAVQEALAVMGTGDLSGAQEKIKSVGLRSFFSNWRLFIKAMCAFYNGADDKAISAFSKIQRPSVPQTASKAFLLILHPEKCRFQKNEEKSPVLELICFLTGHKRLAAVLPRIEYLWQTGRFRDAFIFALNNFPGFPVLSPGMEGALTQFFFNAMFHLPSNRRKHFIDVFSSPKQQKNFDPGIETFLRRNLAIFSEKENRNLHEIIKNWKRHTDIYESVYGRDHDYLARVFNHLGDLCAAEDTYAPFLFCSKNSSQLRDAELAEVFYERSIAERPLAIDAHRSLLMLYEKTGRKGPANKKLDEMSRRFPEDKQVLLINGLRCIQRKAYIKGVRSLEQARALDPLDRQLREQTCMAYVTIARAYAEKRDIERCREFMGRALAISDKGDDYNTSELYLRIRLWVLELFFARVRENSGWLEYPDKAPPDTPPHVFYFAFLICFVYGVNEGRFKKLKKMANTIVREAAGPLTVKLFEILLYVRKMKNQRHSMFLITDSFVEALIRSKKTKCDPLSARKIVQYAMQLEREGKELAETYVQKMLKEDNKNPWFLYYHFLLETHRHYNRFDLKSLDQILHYARERGEKELISLVEKEIQKLHRKIEYDEEKEDFDFFDDDFDDDMDDDFDDDFDDDMDDDMDVEMDAEMDADIARQLFEKIIKGRRSFNAPKRGARRATKKKKAKKAATKKNASDEKVNSSDETLYQTTFADIYEQEK